MLFIHVVLENTLFIVTTSGPTRQVGVVSIIKMADLKQKICLIFLAVS